MGLFGRFALALIVVSFVSRRALLRVFLVPGLILMPIIFSPLPADTRQRSSHMTCRGCPAFTMQRFSARNRHFPRRILPSRSSASGETICRMLIRCTCGTGESFAANIGGRMIGTSFAALTPHLALQSFVPGATPEAKTAMVAAGIATTLFAVNLIFSFVLPEPQPGDVERE